MAVRRYIPFLVLPCIMLACANPAPDRAKPKIDIWYGDYQFFGYSGVPQRWVNILGRLVDPGKQIVRLEYCLNEEKDSAGNDHWIPLAVGPQPDSLLPRRLMRLGDFNIEIHVGRLREGRNRILIRAGSDLGCIVEKEVGFDYGGISTKDRTIEPGWEAGGAVQKSVQIVDGRWHWDQEGIRTLEPGYDRVLAFGDTLWDEVDIYAEFILHRIPDTLEFPGIKRDGKGFGFLIHWLGHSDDPVPGMSPKCGWFPCGGDAWYVAEQALGEKEFGNVLWQVDSYPSDGSRSLMPCNPIVPEAVYAVRMQYALIEGSGTYRMKTWRLGDAEPAGWQLSETAAAENLGNGSVLFVAHYVDMTLKSIKLSPPKSK